jgi:hypothetical protein
VTGLHRYGNDHAATRSGCTVVRIWCECDLLLLAAARTRKQAWKRARRAHRDHEGHALAAGPGRHPGCDW